MKNVIPDPPTDPPKTLDGSRELRDNTFSGSDHEDANEHIEKVLEIVNLFHILDKTQDQVMHRAFPMSLTGAASRWLRNKPSGSIITWKDFKTKFLSKYCPPRTAKKIEEINNFQQEPNETLYQALGGYRAAAPRFYQRNNANPSYQERRQSMEEALSKFMSESAKRHEENSNMIKEIQASTDAAVRNQGASIKTLEIQIRQISNVVQERGFESLLLKPTLEIMSNQF
ncbi:retrotransposon protein [Tanacetum coccineum]